MDRVVEYDKEKELFAMSSMILSMPADLVREVKAFTVFPGLGERWRIEHAVEWWEEKAISADFFLIPGMNLKERTAISFSIDMLKEKFNLKRTDGVIIRSHAEHTKDQADWVIKQVKKFHIPNIALFVSPYHMTRAYLTLLKSALKAKVEFFILPVPTPVFPHTLIPETGVDAWSMIPAEAERIKKYQRKGDVATLEELKRYCSRMSTAMYSNV